jgi:primary-amine oxidase
VDSDNGAGASETRRECEEPGLTKCPYGIDRFIPKFSRPFSVWRLFVTKRHTEKAFTRLDLKNPKFYVASHHCTARHTRIQTKNVAMKTPTHPLDDLTAAEMTAAASTVKSDLLSTSEDVDESHEIRFSYVTLAEPAKAAMRAYLAGEGPVPARQAEVIATIVPKMDAYVFVVNLGEDGASVASKSLVPEGCQPLFSPDDCFLAEEIVKADDAVCAELAERYGVDPADFDTCLVCDPWSVHVATPDFDPLKWRPDGRAARLIQCFLYWRNDEADNQYAKPVDLLPVVDLHARKVISVSKQPGATPPKIGFKTNVNYHRASLETNAYLPTKHRTPMKPLDVTQPAGPNFVVTEGRVVDWDKWSMRLGFNYREGLVIHDATFEGRSVMRRASLVEMAVPYADPNPPFERKCAFDVGDYGLGYCADSLELGCDCLGHIKYFDAVLCDSKGTPYVTKKAICMHEEDMGVLWKHVEYVSIYFRSYGQLE